MSIDPKSTWADQKKLDIHAIRAVKTSIAEQSQTAPSRADRQEEGFQGSNSNGLVCAFYRSVQLRYSIIGTDYWYRLANAVSGLAALISARVDDGVLFVIAEECWDHADHQDVVDELQETLL